MLILLSIIYFSAYLNVLWNCMRRRKILRVIYRDKISRYNSYSICPLLGSATSRTTYILDRHLKLGIRSYYLRYLPCDRCLFYYNSCPRKKEYQNHYITMAINIIQCVPSLIWIRWFFKKSKQMIQALCTSHTRKLMCITFSLNTVSLHY